MRTTSYTGRRKRLSDSEAWRLSCTCELAGECRHCHLWSGLIAAQAIKRVQLNSHLSLMVTLRESAQRRAGR